MSELYPVADTLIHPTLGDTYGMVALEAMSHRLPVIISSSEYCGFSEHLSNEEAIILENPQNSEEISKNIKLLNNHLDLRQKIAKNGLEKSKQINWETTTNKTLETYERLL
jgi:UDP-glucose:(heptosyl)LPS alpha-1,3-glucosyltransferase